MRITLRKKLSILLGLAFGFVLLVALILYGYALEWTGFGGHVSPSGEQVPAKTLWDWMSLILVPVVLFFLARFFTEAQERIERERSSSARENQILEAYFGRMQGLLIDKGLLESSEGSSVRTLARTVSLVTLSQLSGGRRSTVLQFLDEAGLIQGLDTSPIISLSGADLNGVGLPLGVAFLDLRGADLSGADLRNARLDMPNFQDADLRSCVLDDAALFYADLRGANLDGAVLDRTNLYGAVFEKNTILPNGKRWAETDMRIFGAKIKPPYTEKELEQTRREFHMDD